MPYRFPVHLSNKISQRKAENSFRTLSIPEGIDFSSNDFLGMARNEDILNEFIQMHQVQPMEQVGSGGSRLLSGHSEEFDQLEHRLATYFNAEAALLINSGYSANLSLLSSVPQRGDLVLYDAHCHASIKDGIRLSVAQKKSFRHNDSEDLMYRIHSLKGTKNTYVVVESLYSMDGDFCKLAELIEAVKSTGNENIHFIVDEAHSTGLYGGNRNSGSWVVECGLEEEVFARVHTFGKAFGLSGGCVVGSAELKDYLINFARPFIYTTAMSHLNLSALNLALDKVTNAENERNQLFENIRIFKDIIKTESESAIQPLMVKGNREARLTAARLVDSGYDVRAVLSPTVPEGMERIRICLHSFNTRQEIEGLAKLIST